ncbi:MAG: aldehyde ferredoxin oxidoreductase family protein [Methanosarcina sp.]|nr:aldehyde ferredoxin oxidoreductase [Methanosarcina sp. Ant1]
MLGGYAGKILDVNLESGELKDIPLDEAVLRMYLGGKGLGLKLVYNEFRPDMQPFDPDNLLVFATGPATGGKVPTSGRYHVVCSKSPQTGTVGSGNSGGNWGPYLKFAGYDAVLVRGISKEPVYLSIVDGKAELVKAPEIWGMTVHAVTDELTERTGDPKKTSVACIGPAGENLIPFASIMNDKYRTAGRTGLGAVMGSKKLKAIVVSGNKRVEPANPELLKERVADSMKKIRENPVTSPTGGLHTYGTSILVNIINEHGAYPARNFQEAYFPDADEQSGETLVKKYLTGRYGCWGCPIICGRKSDVPDGPFSVRHTEGPEYETIFAFGSNCGIKELDALVKANHLCDELGLDTISMGDTIACAMELVEKGKIPEEKFHGMNLRFGDAGSMIEAIWRTAYRAGFGADLSLGSKKLAEKYGAPELSITVKGMELPAYDPRAIEGMGLNYATANRGGDHVYGYMVSPEILGLPEKLDPYTKEGKPMWTIILQDLTSAINSSVVCLFTSFALGLPEYAGMLAAITGFDLDADKLLKLGERVTNLERLMNNMYGLDRKEDILPRRLTQEPIPTGPSKGHVSHVPEMIDEYYRLRGWIDGKPTAEKLKELGIV